MNLFKDVSTLQFVWIFTGLESITKIVKDSSQREFDRNKIVPLFNIPPVKNRRILILKNAVKYIICFTCFMVNPYYLLLSSFE